MNTTEKIEHLANTMHIGSLSIQFLLEHEDVFTRFCEWVNENQEIDTGDGMSPDKMRADMQVAKDAQFRAGMRAEEMLFTASLAASLGGGVVLDMHSGDAFHVDGNGDGETVEMPPDMSM